MNVVAVIQADLDRSPPGTRSRLSDELVGVPVLRRTVARARQAKHVSAVHVLCPSAQQSRCERLLNESGAAIQPFDAKPAPWSELVQTARKWSLDGWRKNMLHMADSCERTCPEKAAEFRTKAEKGGGE